MSSLLLIRRLTEKLVGFCGVRTSLIPDLNWLRFMNFCN